MMSEKKNNTVKVAPGITPVGYDSGETITLYDIDATIGGPDDQEMSRFLRPRAVRVGGRGTQHAHRCRIVDGDAVRDPDHGRSVPSGPARAAQTM